MPPHRALRPAAVPDDRHPTADSVFGQAAAEVAAGIASQRGIRPEVSFDREQPPRRLAPHAIAVAARVEIGADEIGGGRFVLLYDPAGQDGWIGPFRVIAYLRAELDPEIAADQLIGQVGWSWLIEALESRQAGYAAPGGSVTTVVTEGFGTKCDEPVVTDFEMRASWSPVAEGRDAFRLDRHVAAWVEALCVACGMPPAPPGVAQLPPRPVQLRPAQAAEQPPSGPRRSR
jgi:hypothetical protein